MATNGLITIIKDGRVYRKITAGCNGRAAWLAAEAVAERFRQGHEPYLCQLARICITAGLGCDDCLVASDLQYHEGDVDKDFLQLEFAHWNEPLFNSRWERGSAPYNALIIILKEKTMTYTIDSESGDVDPDWPADCPFRLYNKETGVSVYYKTMEELEADIDRRLGPEGIWTEK
jgi:hypothetical protein